MPRRLLILTVDRYLASFQSRRQSNPGDSFAPKAFEVLEAFKLELGGSRPDLHDSVYTALGFHHGIDQVLSFFGAAPSTNTFAFDRIQIEDNNLASYLLMQRFINEMRAYSIQTAQMTALFGRYLSEALIPALDRYKEAKLSEVSLPKAHQEALKGMLDGLTVCLNHSLGDRITAVMDGGKKILQDAGIAALRYGPLVPLVQGIQDTVNLANENQDLIKVSAFLVRFDFLLLNDGPISTRDFVALNAAAQETRVLLMQMPEIKEVKQYHWIINLICNFINNHIIQAFESQSQKDLNRFFGRWDGLQSQGRGQIQRVESDFRQLSAPIEM